MIKNRLLLCNQNFSLMISFINCAFLDKKTEVELISNCGKTNGRITTAEPNGVIFYCAQRMAKIEHQFKRASYYKKLSNH